MAEETVVQEQQQEEKNHWEVEGYLSELARVCDNLEHLDDTHYLPKDLRDVMEKTLNSTSVEDFNDLTEEDIQHYIGVIRNELPRYYNDVVAAIRDIGRARAIVLDDDFI